MATGSIISRCTSAVFAQTGKWTGSGPVDLDAEHCEAFWQKNPGTPSKGLFLGVRGRAATGRLRRLADLGASTALDLEADPKSRHMSRRLPESLRPSDRRRILVRRSPGLAQGKL